MKQRFRTGTGHRILAVGLQPAARLACWCSLTVALLAGDARIVCAYQKPFDQKSGLDPSSYPPDCPVDFLHLKLELEFEDLTSRSFVGTASLRLRPVHENVTSLTLNAVDFQIVSVRCAGVDNFRYHYDGERLFLHFSQPLPVDSDTVIAIAYRCTEPVNGMVWAIPDQAYPDRPLVIHTQGEAEYARYWFPCLDFPLDRCTSEVIVTVPAPFHAISNGKLVKRTHDPSTGRTTFHYLQDSPHVFYLVSLVIGQFDEVKDRWRDVDVQYFVPQGFGGGPPGANVARLTYGRTPEMMEFFSKLLGVDYPYAKYAQVNVPLFMFGGMENTSATTLMDAALLTTRASIDQDLDGLISHELAHQWFGDLITCRGWKHIWLNEGFATFMNSVWTEHWKGQDEYRYEFLKRFRQVAKADQADSGAGILYSDYRHPDDIFRHKGSMPYRKGACVLHMLRHELGEDLFWRAIRTYVRTYQLKQVETDDFRRVVESVSGRNLEQFFDRWVVRPGTLNLSVDYTWDSGENLATVTVTQTQPISAQTPAFNAPLDLYFRVQGKETRTTMRLTEQKEVYRRAFTHAPELFCVDPEGGLLKKLECTKPRSMWLQQLTDGPTTVSRIVAAEHLSKHGRPEVVEALRAVVARTAEHWTVRSEAAAALGRMVSIRARNALLALLADTNAIAEHKVRASVISAAGNFDTPEMGQAIAAFARSDPSSKVEAVATKALGRIISFNAEAILVENADKESYFNQIRTAAIEALAKRVGATGGLSSSAVNVALKYAAYGRHDRVRPIAIRALGRLGRDDEKRRAEIRSVLIRGLSDPQRRTIRASVEALADIGDTESVAAIRHFLASSPEPRTYIIAENALERAKPDSESQSVATLRDTLKDLREELQRLQERINTLEKRHPTDEP